MTTLQSTAAGLPVRPVLDAERAGVFARAWRALAAALSPVRGRGTLDQLDDHLLKDIGLSRADRVPDPRERVWLP